MSIYRINLMGGASVLCSEEDVAKLVIATNNEFKLVLIGGSLINPSSISSIVRDWNARPEDLEKTSESLKSLLGQKKLLN